MGPGLGVDGDLVDLDGGGRVPLAHHVRQLLARPQLAVLVRVRVRVRVGVRVSRRRRGPQLAVL